MERSIFIPLPAGPFPLTDRLLTSLIVIQPYRSSVLLAPTAARSPFFLGQFDNEGIEADADNVVNQVLAEIGLDVDGKMMDAPTGAPAVAKPAAASETKLDAKTEEMLAQLGAL